MNVGGRLVIQSSQGGRTQQLTLANGSGTVLGDLGLSLASAVGRDTEVSVDIEGTYTGADNDKYVFAPAGDGQIGVTDGLKINVYNQNGALVTELNVGAGYEPGQQLELGSGITVMFGSGTVSHFDWCQPRPRTSVPSGRPLAAPATASTAPSSSGSSARARPGPSACFAGPSRSIC